ncbi:MAM domain-containing protein 2-like [Anguilla anguilla]|uniref:MAM domain-containing protein 2-like n=1 Tax=Anguilla anguilla TaxID=7936 RepID=UPI0015B2EB9F|nr:MAM domain-containing protein 2-like [Anguilla anguilla]
MLQVLFLSLHFVVGGAQTLPGSCRFENGTCGYVSDPSLSKWALNKDGGFIAVDGPLTEGRERAVLVSPELEMSDWSCVRLVYQITGSGSLHFHLRPEGGTFDQTLWTADQPSDSWLVASIDLWNTSASHKMVVEGRLGRGANNSVSIFEIRIVPGYCIECNFEDPHMCGYRNQWNPSVNWYIGKPNKETQPNLSTWTGHYMYVDSTYAGKPQEVARLVSPMTTAPLSGCLSFYYLQNRDGGSEFSVFTRDVLGQGEEIWRPGNYHTANWTLVQLDLKAPYPLEVVFEAAFNNASGGRVALDNISFSAEFCNAETEPTFDPSVANCDFESGFCGYQQAQTGWSLWKRVSIKPNLYRTGDHTTGAGWFLLANTRFSSRSGYMSRLVGPRVPARLKYCLRFYYALAGFRKTDSVLAVYAFHKDSHTQEKLWTSSGTTRDVWTEVDVTFQRPEAVTVLFVSVCKNFWDCGSVALDDISMTLGDCYLPSGSFLSISGQCDFERGDCGYTQEKEVDTVDWVLARGPTPTSFTGPMGDHTTGMGHYMYLEASPMLAGQNARLASGDLRGSRSPQCLHFHYHMFGSGIGRLNVYLRQEGHDQEEVLWSRHGEQSISWLRAEVDYKCDRKHQIVFEAVRGASIRSDIAIDDIMFTKGPCKAAGHTASQAGFSANFNDIEH